jgi:hypothetical protein
MWSGQPCRHPRVRITEGGEQLCLLCTQLVPPPPPTTEEVAA